MRLIDADALEKEFCSGCQYENNKYSNCIDCALAHAPTIEERKWIPCRERLPEEKDAGIIKKLGTSKRSEYVLATVEVKGERMTVTACTYDGEWHFNMKYAFPDYKIIAWMPLPEPYKERRTDDLQ